MSPSLLDIFVARRRLAGRLRPTPLVRSHALSGSGGAPVLLKLESLQITGSFKARGALNALVALTSGRRAAGSDSASRTHVVTGSAGNHGRALAWAAAELGLHATIFTPSGAPAVKLDAIRRLGADLRAVASDYDEAEALARSWASSTGATFVSPYSDADVIAGAGTIALEIFDLVPDVGTIVVPVGGGGLAAGIAIAAKAIAPGLEVVGVEAEASTAFSASLAAGRITHVEVGATIADGLAGNLDPVSITFPIVQRAVDRIVTLPERDVIGAIRALAASDHLVAEGAGAAAAGAILAGHVSPRDPVVAIVSGSNIDREKLREIL